MALNSPAGTMLVVAAAACAIGALLPPVYATILAGAMLVSGLVAFSIRRAEHVLDTILTEELSRPEDRGPKKTA